MASVSDQVVPEKSHEEGCKWLARGQIEQACEAFCRALDACPEALDDIATAFGRRADREQAVAAFERQLGPNGARASQYALAARLTRDLGRLDEARRWAERAVRADPTRAPWWLELAEVHMATGCNREAAAAYRRCLAIDPRQTVARARLAICRQRRWAPLARLLARWRLTHHVLWRLAGPGKTTPGILEMRADSAGTDSAGAHQRRWARALEQGSTLALFTETPAGQEPKNFAEHWKNCHCIYWQWFLAQGVESDIKTVLDVGCGTGHLAEHFLYQGFDVTGVTVNPHEKKECLRRGLKVIEDDFHFLSVADESFDMVVSSHSLEHSISPLFALWEWKRVVRPGGFLLICLPTATDQDARAALPENYDAERDALSFPVPEGMPVSPEEIRCATSTYNTGLHVYILGYWQLRWLFRFSGLELVADAAEDPIAGQALGVEYLDGRVAHDPLRPLNGMFLLRKPQRDEAPNISAKNARG